MDKRCTPWDFAKEECVYLNYATTSFPKSKIALESFYKAACTLPDGSRQNSSNSYLQKFRNRVGKILNAREEHIFFTTSATIGLNQVIHGFMKDGFCLAIDNRSHNAVARPWLSLTNRCQCILAALYDEADQFIEANLLEILSQSPHLLCLTHVSNVTGSIYPIERIIDLVRSLSPSTSVLIDASQSAGAISLADLGRADFVVFPAHKHLHSLPGAAVLMAKKRLEPIILGGTGANSGLAETFNGKDLFAEVGTMNFPAIWALVDSLEFADLNLQQHRKHEQHLLAQFIEGIHQIEGLELVGRGAEDERVGIIALKPEVGSPELQWAPFLKTQKIFVRGGLHCSPLHHEQLGLSNSGTLRLSFGWDSTAEHVTTALRSLKEFNHVIRDAFNDSTV